MSALSRQHVERYRQVARLLWRHGRSVPPPVDGDEPLPEAEQLAADLEAMGPTFVKLGQLLSTRADLLPAPYLDALSRLQDDVDPVAFKHVERTIADDLGLRLSRAFAEFDRQPLAAASLAQVHRAVLRDGRRVAVKVQRPGLRRTVTADLKALGHVVGLVDRHTDAGRRYRVAELMDEFRTSLLRELDFLAEARNLEVLGELLAGYERIVVPAPIPDFCSPRVLTADDVDSRKITDVGPLGLLELDGAALADELFRAYLDQILVHGFFHADPHPGNVRLTRDGRLVLLDLGMVARLVPRVQEQLVRLLLAIGDGRVEEATQVAVDLGEAEPDFDRSRLEQRLAGIVGDLDRFPASDVQVGTLVLDVCRAATEEGLRPRTELALLGKTMLNLDTVGHTLDPDFDPNASVQRHVADIMARRLWREASPSTLLDSVLEVREFVRELPGRVNRIMDTVATGQFEVKVDAIDERQLMVMAQKVANRVTTGLVLAALIVGAAMLMQVDTAFTILGYPALAIVLFLAAATAGFVLLAGIFWSDEHRPGRRDRRR